MKPYGCHSQPRKDGYWAQVRYFWPDGSWKLVDEFIRDTMTKECNYRKTTPDPRCQGCARP